jgi:hypothetical protein
MSSHREAPEISRDPVADSTDLYAFVSPDKPDTVTLIANYIPAEVPAGGPNFYNFGDDVLYEIHISNAGSAASDISYQFRFTTQIQNPNSFLYNSGPIQSLTDANWNLRQTYSVTRVSGGQSTTLASGLACPPCNIGARSTPSYSALAQAAIHALPSGETVFAGQRDDPFYVDLGAIFDLGDIRPLQHLHLIPTPDAAGVNTLKGINVHSIAIQLPKRMLTAGGSNPTDPASAGSVIGVWTTASRQKASVLGGGANGSDMQSGPWVQRSRLGNPLVNEVVIPMGQKDAWNAADPSGDSQYATAYTQPELAKLLPVLYPNVFPNLSGLSADRADLVAILLTGIPSGIVPGFQNNTGTAQADMLRLNMAIPPASSPNAAGVVGGDLAGFPNGRRIQDDVVTIALRAVAGATYALVAPSYKPDDAVGLVTGGVSAADNPATPLPSFPYIADPNPGF